VSRLGFALSLVLLTFGCHETRSVEPPVPDEHRQPATDAEIRESEALPQRWIYVPAYSHISRGGGEETLLSITLSVRNVDPVEGAMLVAVDYFNTSGQRVRRYLDRPRKLRALESAEFVVEVSDEAGGAGANFLVHWRGLEPMNPILTEAVMVGHTGSGLVSFTSRGVDLRSPPSTTAPTEATTPEPLAPGAPQTHEVVNPWAN
jgi:hypothetical protein